MKFSSLREAKKGDKSTIMRMYRFFKSYVFIDDKNNKATICDDYQGRKKMRKSDFQILQEMILSLETKIVTRLDTISSKVDLNTEEIKKNREAIEQNTEEIKNNRKAIEQNTEEIKKNRKAIEQNTEAIEQNRQAININRHLISKMMQTPTMKKELEDLAKR